MGYGIGTVSDYANSVYADRIKRMQRAGISSETANGSALLPQKENANNVSPGRIELRFGAESAYTLSARYAEDSTKDDPAVVVAVSHDGYEEEYKVRINDVDPANATELQMFAAFSYLDDMGVSESLGVPDTYGRLYAHERCAAKNGIEGCLAPDFDAFLNETKHFPKMIDEIAEDYTSAGIFAPSAECAKIYSVAHKLFWGHENKDNSIVGAAIDMSHTATLTPPELTGEGYFWNGKAGELWAKAEEAAYRKRNGYQQGDWVRYTGRSAYDQMQKRYRECLENGSEDPVLDAAKACLTALEEFELTPEIEASPGLLEDIERQKRLYRSFIGMLEGPQTEETDALSKEGEASETDETDDLSALIKEYMEKIFEKVKNGEPEESFQIGGTSMTIREWDKLLERFDDAQEELRRLVEEEMQERQEHEEKKKELNDEQLERLFGETL